MTTPYVKLDAPLNELTLICRGCLVESGEMKNMFDWGLFEDFFKYTEVSVLSDDGLSHLLCTACEETLTLCKQFRSQCQKSDLLLKDSVKSTKNTIVEENNSITSQVFDRKLVFKITAPNTEEKVYISCPHCGASFIKKRDLMHHLGKVHEVRDKEFTIDLQYFCSFDSCPYHMSSYVQKHFSGRKFLNQHYNKVHRLKVYHCTVCGSSFATPSEYNRHVKCCNMIFKCDACNSQYNTNEKLLVHLMRKHPALHRQYKTKRKSEKRAKSLNEGKKVRIETERISEYVCDSPKRSFATQTLSLEDRIKNDVTLPPWQTSLSKTDDTSTQTVFEDLLSLKSQTSEDESIFFSETVSLSDIQTQTFPLEFGLSRLNKRTVTSGTQSPDLSIKETQTCSCHYDSPKPFFKLFDSICSSPTANFSTAETQTTLKTDVRLNSAEIQTCDS